MEWEHKGIRFSIEVEPMGPLYLASAKAPKEGIFVRFRPFSAIGTSQEKAIELLKEQVCFEYRSLPEVVPE